MTIRKSILHVIACKRGCGKTLTTLRRPIHKGRQAQYDRLGGICGDCLTRHELIELGQNPDDWQSGGS